MTAPPARRDLPVYVYGASRALRSSSAADLTNKERHQTEQLIVQTLYFHLCVPTLCLSTVRTSCPAFRFSAGISLIWKITCKSSNLCNDIIRTHVLIVSWFVLQSKYDRCRALLLANTYFLFLLLVNGGAMLGRGCRCVRYAHRGAAGRSY